MIKEGVIWDQEGEESTMWCRNLNYGGFLGGKEIGW